MMGIDPDDIRCTYCWRRPEEIDEYLPGTLEQCEAGERAWEVGEYRSPADYVSKEEGTFNSENGHFACTECYVRIGAPSSPHGWVAP